MKKIIFLILIIGFFQKCALPGRKVEDVLGQQVHSNNGVVLIDYYLEPEVDNRRKVYLVVQRHIWATSNPADIYAKAMYGKAIQEMQSRYHQTLRLYINKINQLMGDDGFSNYIILDEIKDDNWFEKIFPKYSSNRMHTIIPVLFERKDKILNIEEKETAIKRLKEAKELLTLGVISQQEYDELKNELSEIIKKDFNE